MKRKIARVSGVAAASMFVMASCAPAGSVERNIDPVGPDAGELDSPIKLGETGESDGPASLDTSVPPPECVTDNGCNNGLACDGVERCVDGVCVDGAAIMCDDDVTCTIDRCVEPLGECSHEASDALCGPDETCDMLTGCFAGCLEDPCRVVSPQCGCGEGKGCYFTPDGTRTCGEAGVIGEAQECATVTACVPGLACVNVSSEDIYGLCSRACREDRDCVGAGSLCVHPLVDTSGAEVPEGRVCSHACDPITQEGCPTDAACQIHQEPDGDKRLYTQCAAPTGLQTQGFPCVSSTDCTRGHVCLDLDGPASAWEKSCLHWCDVATGAGCRAGTICFSFIEPITVAGVEYGLCG